MWIVLLDNSGSMGSPFKNDYKPRGRVQSLSGDAKLDAAKKALINHIETLDPDQQIVICTFNGNTEHLGSDFHASDTSRIETLLSQVVPFNGTDLAGALAFSRQFISTPGAKILIVSDGLTNQLEAINGAVTLATKGVWLFFILIDPNKNTEELARKVTGPSGGFYWSVRSPDEVEEGLKSSKATSDAADAAVSEAVNDALAIPLPSPDEAISFTAGYPAAIPRKQWSLLTCAVHLKKLTDSVRMLIESQFTLEESEPHVELSSSDSSVLFPEGTLVRIVPNASGISFRPSSYSINWGGMLDTVLFSMRPNEKCDGDTIGTVDFFANGVLVARLVLDLHLSEQPASSEWRISNENDISRVFLSYSRKDSSVVDKYEKLWKSAGIEYFRDTESLRSGDDWQQKIATAVYNSSLFQLFWSVNASESQWVKKEYTIALSIKEDKGERFIRPVAWEEDIPSLPEELENIQVSVVKL